jgi:hypothetical protein
MKLRISSAIILIAGSLALSFILVIFNDQIAAITHIPPQAPSYIAGALLVGFFEGISTIRDILRERDQRKLAHSKQLSKCLREWIRIPLVRDQVLNEPKSVWLEECKQHLISSKVIYSYQAPDENLLVLSPWNLYVDYARKYADIQYETHLEVKKTIEREIVQAIKKVNTTFVNADVVSTTGQERYYVKGALVDYVYSQLTTKKDVALEIKQLGNRFMLYQDSETYVWSSRYGEIDAIRKFIRTFSTNDELMKKLSYKDQLYRWADWAFSYFKADLLDMVKDIESFRPLDGHCEKCP